MARFFDAEGNEYKIESNPNAEVVGEFGGLFGKTGITLQIYSKNLDKDRISQLLEVKPTNSWNANEKHSYGFHGHTRIDNFGKWFISTEIDEVPINQKLEKLFANCSQNLSNWLLLSTEYDTWLTITVFMNNFNEQISLSTKALSLIAERNLDLTFDAYEPTGQDDDG